MASLQLIQRCGQVGKLAKYLPEFGWEPIVLTVDEVKGYSQNLPVEIDEGEKRKGNY